jgi:hypothetical protein
VIGLLQTNANTFKTRCSPFFWSLFLPTCLHRLKLQFDTRRLQLQCMCCFPQL